MYKIYERSFTLKLKILLVFDRLTVAGGEAEEIDKGRGIVVGVQEKDMKGVGITGDEL